jgi:cation diffusion facilitator CzcD-associated flavoprotein CzcO
MKFFRLRHQVVGAYWDDEKGLWDVHVKELTTGQTFIDSAEIFINGGGILK